MSAATETNAKNDAPAPNETPSLPLIVPAAQGYSILDAIGRHKNNPDYLKRGEEGVAEYRRMIQEELERHLAEEGK